VILTDNMRGAAFMVGSMTAFTVNDMFVKLMGETLPLFQLLFLRSVGVTVLFFAICKARGLFGQKVSRVDRNLIVGRTIAEVGAAYFFLSALIEMPLANVTAILQALPLTVTLGVALFLGEDVGWRRFAAIGVGFIGVYLIIRPEAEGFSIWSVYALLAVVCVTARDLFSRRMSRALPSLKVSFFTGCGLLVFSGVGAAFVDWQPMTARHWFYLTGSVLTVMAAYLFSVMAVRVGEIGFVSPFRYTSLVVALILGFLVFGEWPDRVTLIGASIVVATGLFTFWRERALSRRKL